jgi:hypothetical protein
MATLLGGMRRFARGGIKEKTPPRAFANLFLRVVRRSVLHVLLHTRLAIRLDLF